MSVEVRLWRGGRAVTVRLDAATVSVGDASHAIGAVTAGPRATAAGGATVEELALEIDGRPRRALVARARDRVLVALGGRVYVFATGEATRTGGAGGAGSGTVVAPMPGKVVAVLVAAGDTVEPGQPLVVLEAMKMESTLVAEVAGTVKTVAAVPGATVDGGALLVEIAPAA